jgi:methionyl-tRNA formyltransferase
MRAVFFGTPEIAVPALEALQAIATVSAVVCQPDRPAGRGLALKPPPVKARALELGLPVVQPEKVRTEEFAAWLRAERADVALVIAYGRILPPAVLAAAAHGCMNLHASLLPKYRGAAPIQWAVAHGERETGISLMQMDEGMDTGPVYARRSLPIGPDETAGELAVRLAALAAEVVRADLPRAVSGELRAEPQDGALATMAPILKKEDGSADWSRPAREVHDRARGMTPWPGAHTKLGGKHFKLLATRVAADAGDEGAPGAVTAIPPEGARIACGSGAIFLLRGQLEGKKPLSTAELAAGRTLAPGTRFG